VVVAMSAQRKLGFAIAILALALSSMTVMASSAAAAEDRIAGFTTSATNGEAPFEVQFSSTGPDDAAGWSWDFGDGSTGSTAAPSHSYVAAGTFTVQLTMLFEKDRPIVITKVDLIVVTATPPAPPIAGLIVAGSVQMVGVPVTFLDASSGDPTSWAWDFGDGGTSIVAEATHTYLRAGKYSVTLTVGNSGGNSATTASIAILATWTGGVQLYRNGAFSPQLTYHWCAAASAQTMRNIVTGQRDHSNANQSRYYVFGRSHNGYRTPDADGLDPAGWQAVLRRWVDPAYHIVASSTYVGALQAAARAMRVTGRPVGVLVGFGAHVWVISGFSATADPAITTKFTVTSVNVEGPLYGHPAVNGFDQAPNVRLSTDRFRYFLTPYRDHFEPLGWRNRYVVLAP
jgi:PKD repeat protein